MCLIRCYIWLEKVNRCYGCAINHPSQRLHCCLMIIPGQWRWLCLGKLDNRVRMQNSRYRTFYEGAQRCKRVSPHSPWGNPQYIWVIDQAWGRDGWILAKFFFACLWTETMSRSINTQKRTRPISSHLDRTSLVNKGFIIWDKTPRYDKFSLRDKARIPSGQDSSILPARVANHSARFGSSCPLAELVI